MSKKVERVYESKEKLVNFAKKLEKVYISEYNIYNTVKMFKNI